MMFGNLLKIASSVIPTQTVTWKKFMGKQIKPGGIYEDTYSEPVEIRGSFQATDDRDVKEMGLDTSKRYRTLYTSHDISDVKRGSSPDKISFNGENYEVVGITDWFAQDGWRGVVCVRVADDK